VTCEHVQLPNGASAIVCGSRRAQRCRCGRKATLLCDWKVPSRKSGTCDQPMCAGCATSAAPGKDICPDHAPAFREWKLKSRAAE
jgi:hypothetical protein